MWKTILYMIFKHTLMNFNTYQEKCQGNNEFSSYVK